MKIQNLKIEELENPGCNNGNYPTWTGTDETGKAVSGQTCNCLAGCSGQDRLEDYNPQTGTAILVTA